MKGQHSNNTSIQQHSSRADIHKNCVTHEFFLLQHFLDLAETAHIHEALGEVRATTDELCITLCRQSPCRLGHFRGEAQTCAALVLQAHRLVVDVHLRVLGEPVLISADSSRNKNKNKQTNKQTKKQNKQHHG